MTLIDTTEYIKSKKVKKATVKKIGCEACQLSKDCYHPKMLPYGKGELGIAIIVEGVSDKEDAVGELLCGEVGEVLKREFQKKGIDLLRDCTVFPLVQCYKDGDIVQGDINKCHIRFIKQLTEFMPEVIVAFGDIPIKQLFREASVGLSQLTTHGAIIPSDEYGCNVLCSFDVSHFLDNRHNKDDYHLIGEVIANILPSIKEDYKSKQLDDKYELYLNFNDVVNFFEKLLIYKQPVSFDYEATGLDPFKKEFKLLTASFSTDERGGVCVPLEHPDKKWKKKELEVIYDYLRRWIVSDCPKWIQNSAFEDVCSRVVFGAVLNNCARDSLIMQHLLDHRNNICAQRFHIVCRYGSDYSKEEDVT